MNGLRTLIGAIGGLVYLLALAYLSGTLPLPAETTGNLAYAGMLMVASLASKGSVEVAAYAYTRKPPPTAT